MRPMRYALAFAGIVAAAGVAEACPNWQLAPAFGQINLSAGFLPDPYTRNVTAGGSYNLQSCLNNAWGWVAAAPDFDLYYQTNGTYQLTIAIESNADTVLLINAPDGQWYFDDDGGYGLGGGITFTNPRSGLYDIWIGTYNRASGIPARLIITELSY